MSRPFASKIFALVAFAPLASVVIASAACSSPATPNLQDEFGGPSSSAAAATTSAKDADAGATSGSSSTSTSSTTPAPTGAADDAGTSDPAPVSTGDASTGIACPYTGPKLNVDKYPTCLAGGRCVPATTVPVAEQASFATCDTGFCLPEKVVASLGQYLPTTCVAAEGAEGRCLSTVLPSVSAMGKQLQQATCDTNELCTPCYNPMDGSDTGACSTVKCDAPKEAAVTFGDCCTLQGAPQGKCVPADLVSSVVSQSAVSTLYSCNDSNNNVCAPTENLSADFQPVYCEYDDGFLGIGNYSGFCVSDCLKGLGDLDRGSCDKKHMCAPCHDGDGNPTNVPGCKY